MQPDGELRDIGYVGIHYGVECSVTILVTVQS